MDRSVESCQAPGWVRGLERAAGLMSGGLVAIGVVLVALQLAAPALAPGEDLAAATGPGWGRITAHVVVGALGESAYLVRRASAAAVRGAVAIAVIVAGFAVVYLAWWA